MRWLGTQLECSPRGPRLIALLLDTRDGMGEDGRGERCASQLGHAQGGGDLTRERFDRQSQRILLGLVFLG